MEYGWIVEGLRLSAAGAVGAGITAFVIYMAKEWLLERLKQGIKHEYDLAIEREKALLATNSEKLLRQIQSEFEQRMAVQASALSALATMHSASSERRIAAIEKLWAHMLELRKRLPAVVQMYEVLEGGLNRDATRSVLGDPKLLPPLHESMTKLFSDEAGLEKDRPFLGELLWSLHTVYRGMMLRSLVFFHAWWEDDESIAKIVNDKVLGEVLSELLGPTELQNFGSGPAANLRIRRAIEQKLLHSANKVLSGESSADFSLEQATRVAAAIEKLREASKQSISQARA